MGTIEKYQINVEYFLSSKFSFCFAKITKSKRNKGTERERMVKMPLKDEIRMNHSS